MRADAAGAALGTMLGPFRRAVALKGELGESSVPATIELSDEPGVASFQAAAAGPRPRSTSCGGLGTEGVVERPSC